MREGTSKIKSNRIKDERFCRSYVVEFVASFNRRRGKTLVKSIAWLLLILCISCTFQRDKAGNDSSTFFESPSCTPLSFAQIQNEIFGTPANAQGKCLFCHQVGSSLIALNSYDAVKSRLGQIEDSVRNNRMPKNSPLSADKKRLLFSWIQQGSPELADPTKVSENCDSGKDPVPSPNPTPVLIEPNYESLRQNIFASRCLGCHDDSGIFSLYDFSSYESIVNYQKLFELPADGSESRFVKALVSGSMPKNGTPLIADQIEVIRQWVALGLPKTANDVGTTLPGPEPMPVPVPDPCDLIDFATVNKKVFEAKCTRCHDFTAKLDLQSFANIKSHLKEIEWVIKNDKMPPKKPLDQDLKDSVLKWISQGAPETVTLPENCENKNQPTEISIF